MRSAAGFLWVLIFSLVAVLPTGAADYLNENAVITNAPRSATEHFVFTLSGKGANPRFDLNIKMTQGRAELRILDPAGRERLRMGAQEYTGHEQPIVGRKVQVDFGGGLIRAGLMILVGATCTVVWRRRGVEWRWFCIGAGLWLVAVIVKFAIAIPFNLVIVRWLKGSLPYWVYLTTGTFCGGVMTGITEILFVFIAALIWRRMTATADRGVAIGVGAGSFEAALLGLGIAAMAISGEVGSATPPGTYRVEVTTTNAVGEWHLRIHDAEAKPNVSPAKAVSPWTMALVGPAERLIAILCHVASRALVLLAVARRRWALFWYGFALLSGVDAMATFFWLSDQVSKLSPWSMEALLAPFGLISIPITIWCMRHWPTTPEGHSMHPAQAGGGLQ